MAALRVVSVSLGSSRRNKQVETELLGIPISIERIGVDGKFYRAVEVIQQLAPQVDAIRLGGIDLYLHAGAKRYVIRDALKLKAAAGATRVADGSAVKNTLEKEQVEYLAASRPEIPLKNRKTLMVSSVDRMGMSLALSRITEEIIFGDLIFAVGLPIPIRRYSTVVSLARVMLPVMTKLPFQVLYPTGKKQESTRPKHRRWLEWAEVVAGDFHFIRRNLPDDMSGKVVITNTTTEEDRALLAQRELPWLVTTTPVIDGRSFGANVLEASIWALVRHFGDAETEDNFRIYLNKLDLKPSVFQLRAGNLEPAG